MSAVGLNVLAAARSKQEDKTEGRLAINWCLDECCAENGKNPLLSANLVPSLHMNGRNVRDHNHEFNKKYIWSVNYS